MHYKDCQICSKHRVVHGAMYQIHLLYETSQSLAGTEEREREREREVMSSARIDEGYSGSNVKSRGTKK